MSRKKTVLCTGSCGFIFTNFLRIAVTKNKEDFNWASIDKLVPQHSIKNIYANRSHDFYIGDVSDAHFVNRVFDIVKPDIIVHGAAESVSEDTIIPYMGPKKIEHLEVKDLWSRFKKRNNIRKIGKLNNIFSTVEDATIVEVMDLDSDQQRALTIKNGFGQWRKIKQISRHWYEGKMVRMVQKWGEISVTPNHSIYNSNMDLVTPSEDVELLSIRHIQPSHSLKDKISNFGDFNWKSSIDDLLFVIAFYITEGWASFNKANGGYIVGFCQNDLKDVEKISNILKNNFKVNTYINKTKKCKSITVSNKKLYDTFIKLCGKGSGAKKLPSFIFTLNKDLKKKFIEYLVYFDGHKYTETNKKYTTNSRLLASQLSTLFSMVDQNYSYSRQIHKKEIWSDSYNFQLSDRYNKLNKSKYEEYEYKGWVYDLEIDDTHKFVCGLGNVVVHNTHVDDSIKLAPSFVNNNVLGTQVLIDASVRHGVERFIYISTDEVYGQLKNEDNPWTEESPLNPRNPYSASKAAGEMLVKAAHETHGLKYNITRCCNNFGPKQSSKNLIPKVIKCILNKKPIPIYGQGLQCREWIHVADNCRAILQILKSDQPNQVYNITANYEISNLEMVHTICNLMESGHDLISFINDPRPGHDFRYAMDNSRIKSIGWSPKFKFKDGLNRCISWYINNQWYLNLTICNH